MKFGLFGINFGVCVTPAAIARIAKAAEDAGFESLWTGEHVVLPDPRVAPSPMAPDAPMLDPAVALAFAAAHTKTIRLGTGIIILPQRNPLVLAKELASVDVVSGGRLIFGLGVGYLKPEFDALGIPFDNKGPRTTEYLEAMLAMWTQASPAYEGRFVSFKGIQAMPRPVQKPHPPIVVGGHTAGAFRRSVQYANGWYGFALDLEKTAQCLNGIREAEAQIARPRELGPLEITITPGVALTPEIVARYAELGVHRLVVNNRAKTEDELLALIDTTAKTFIGKG